MYLQFGCKDRFSHEGFFSLFFLFRHFDAAEQFIKKQIFAADLLRVFGKLYELVFYSYPLWYLNFSRDELFIVYEKKRKDKAQGYSFHTGEKKGKIKT